MLREPDAYGMEIYSKVCELADRQMSLGSIFVRLNRLQRNRYVSSRIASGSTRGGKRRSYYRMSDAGFQGLRESVETATRISEAYWSAKNRDRKYGQEFPFALSSTSV